MSGHSKWATTKRRKGAVDAKRSANFTKLANIIAVAARSGGDPETNFKLRIAIDKAREYSLPKENIERAIKRGTGELAGSQIEELTYEGFGPEGIAIIIEVVTDNKNRAVSEVKHLLNKYGGSLSSQGSVKWQFNYQGVVSLKEKQLTDEQELALIDAGVEDIDTEDNITLYTRVEDLEKIKEKVKNLGLTLEEANLEYVAKELVKPNNEESLLKLFEELEACDDVSNFYSNADV